MAQAFKHDLANDPEFANANYSQDDLQGLRGTARDRLSRLARDAQVPLCILSAEILSTFDEQELADTQAFMADFFDAVEVFIYVRPLKARMESGLQEILKTRYQSLAERVPLNYMGLSRKFDQAFGRDHVHFFKFSRDTFSDGGVVGHFLAAAGIDGQPTAEQPANPRLSKEAVQLLYAYRKYFPRSQRGDQALLNRLAELGQTPFHLHSSLFYELLHTGPNAARRFAERAGFSVEEDIQRHDDVGIRNEDDMLAFPRESIQWLHGQLSLAHKLKFRRSSRPEKVAQALNSLRSAT